MVDKSLYASMDAHFDKVKSIQPKPKIVKKKKESLFLHHLETLKNYLFPSMHFECSKIDNNSTTIVHRIDQGIHRHIRFVKDKICSLFEKKSRMVPEEPEDVDVELVKEVLRKDKLD